MISNRMLLLRINHLISCHSSFCGQCRAFAAIVAGYKTVKKEKAQSHDAKLQQVEEWAEKTCVDKMQGVETVGREDGLHLADLAIRQADRKPLSEYVSISLNIPRHCALICSRYLHLAKLCAKFTAFSVAFVTRLLRLTGPERAHLVDDAFNDFLEFFTRFLRKFSVECQSLVKRGRSESDSIPNPVQCTISADDVVTLLDLLDRRDLEIEVLKLIGKLEAEAGIVDVAAFESFFLPLLEALIATISWTSEQVTRYRKLFQTTLSMYARCFVQIEPQAGNWTNTPRGCGCVNCRELDKFLVNASQQSMRFSGKSGVKQHLRRMLDRTSIRHDIDRTGVETLVVTKPTTPSLVKHEEWQKRFSKAEEQIKKLDQETLKQLLDVDYEFLTELRKSRRGREELPSARVAVRRQGPDIIDLT